MSSNRAGSLRKDKDEFKNYKTGTAALQEIRWNGFGIMDTENFTFFNSGNRNRIF